MKPEGRKSLRKTSAQILKQAVAKAECKTNHSKIFAFNKLDERKISIPQYTAKTKKDKLQFVWALFRKNWAASEPESDFKKHF